VPEGESDEPKMPVRVFDQSSNFEVPCVEVEDKILIKIKSKIKNKIPRPSCGERYLPT